MSAFCDIWINKDGTHYTDVRSGNNSWQNVVGNLWLSLPSNNKAFYRQYTINGYTLILIGQLYEMWTDAEMLHNCIKYIEQPETGYNDPAGHYILFVNHEQGKQTHVFTNRLGSYHAYWSTEGVISTQYLPMAKTSTDKKLDWYGISGFMATGYFPADATFLEGIKILEPASYYCFNEQLQLKQKKRYWQWTYEPVDKPAEQYIEELHEILQSSISVSTADQRLCLPISGGLDSRLLAGELSNSNNFSYKSINALSYGYTNNSPETEIAKEIAHAVNMPIHGYVMPDYLFSQLDEITEAVELFQYVDGTRQASAVSWLSEHSDVVVGGHWGDVWMDSNGIETTTDLQPAFEKKIIKRGAAWLLENICDKHVKDSLVESIEYFNSFTKQYDYIDNAAFRMKIYKTDQWSFRWTAASLRMYQQGAFPVLPFYDKRIVGLFSTIPESVISNRALQVDYIKQYYPDLAKITWQEYDANLYNYKYFNNRNLAYRVADKVKRTVMQQPVIQRNWEVFYLHPKGREKLESILLNSTALNDILPQQKVKQLLDDFYNEPTGANGYTVTMLLTFTLFLNHLY